MTLPDRETLLAVGVTLVVTGFIFRGFAATARRNVARRREHHLDDRKTGEAYLSDEFDKPPGWFEKNLGLIANLILAAGAVLTLLGFTRH